MASGAGVIRPTNPFDAPPPVAKPPSIFDIYGGSLKQTEEDYDSLMSGYKNLLGTSGANPIRPISFSPNTSSFSFAPTNVSTVTPTTTPYSQSGDTTRALGDLGELSRTGGYSDADIANIRARGISPIRAVYANAQRNIDRQKSLQGGFSPGYQAATAKMARELSDQIASQVTNINAQLAQSIAGNRLSASGTYAGAAGSEASRAADIARGNTDAANRAGEFNVSATNENARSNADRSLSVQEANARINSENAANKLAVDKNNQGIGAMNQDQLLKIMQSMQSLYGTTPALASTFGNQALTANGQNIGVANANANRPLPNVSTPIFNPLANQNSVVNPNLTRIGGR